MKTFKIVCEITVELQAFEQQDALDAVSDGLLDCVPGGNVQYHLLEVKEK